MKPEKMSPEVLRNTLKRLCLHVPEAHNAALRLEAHIAALEQERDAAVADNAAKDKAFSKYVTMYGVQHADIPGTETTCPEDDTCECPHVLALNAAFGSGHPGTALLEEHRRALEQRDAALRLAAMTQETVERLNTQIDRDARDHETALVKARNEGLEKAAARFDEEANRWAGTHAATIAEQNASAIRALKEPEE